MRTLCDPCWRRLSARSTTQTRRKVMQRACSHSLTSPGSTSMFPSRGEHSSVPNSWGTLQRSHLVGSAIRSLKGSERYYLAHRQRSLSFSHGQRRQYIIRHHSRLSAVRMPVMPLVNTRLCQNDLDVSLFVARWRVVVTFYVHGVSVSKRLSFGQLVPAAAPFRHGPMSNSSRGASARAFARSMSETGCMQACPEHGPAATLHRSQIDHRILGGEMQTR
jgi:hypothetical protein